MMHLPFTVYGYYGLLVFILLSVVPPCTCRKNLCNLQPQTETRGIYFTLKDKNTGQDKLSYAGSAQPVPDSIRLRDLRSGLYYALYIGQQVNEAIIYSIQYKRPAGVVDSLIFIFGNAAPDTLVVFTGTVKGWRGDECPFAQDAGIVKVLLHGQVLLDTQYDDAVIPLRK